MNPRQLQRLAVAAIVAAGIVLVDQTTKAVAIATLHEDARVPLLGDLLGLQLAYNPGALLSLGSAFTGILTLVGVGAVAWVIIAAIRAPTGWLAVAFGVILGGALGNLIDRLFSPPAFGVGHVTDFLAYGHLFIGNLADVALGIGVVLLLTITWTHHRKADMTPATHVKAGAA